MFQTLVRRNCRETPRFGARELKQRQIGFQDLLQARQRLREV